MVYGGGSVGLGGLSKASAIAGGFGSEGGLTRQAATGQSNSLAERLGKSTEKQENIANLLNLNMNVDYEEDLQAEIMKQREE